MRIGDLKHKIIIQQCTVTINSNGVEEEIWTDFQTHWSAVSNLHGRELFQAMQIQKEKTVKFTIRYTNSIDESMRIVFQDHFYNILFIDNIKYGNRWLEILVEVI